MADLISRAAAIDYLMTNMGWRDEDGYEVDDADEKLAIITDLLNGVPTIDAIPVAKYKAEIETLRSRCYPGAEDAFERKAYGCLKIVPVSYGTKSVDAIPVEWMREKMRGYASSLKSTETAALVIVMQMWQKEQEAR